jgi:hypothetical protein
VEGRPAASCQVMAGLFGQHGLGPGLRAGEVEATGRPLGMAFIEGQTLEAASPQEFSNQATRVVLEAEVARGRKWAMYQALERTWTCCFRVSSLRVLQDWGILSIPERTWSQKSWTVREKMGEMVKPRPLTEEEAKIYWRGQYWRPALEPRPTICCFVVSVEEGSRGSLEVPAGQVHPDNVLNVIPEDLEIVHVPKGGLPDVGHMEGSRDSLQPDQEGLQVDDEEEGSQGVPLADGEDGEDAGGPMEEQPLCEG